MIFEQILKVPILTRQYLKKRLQKKARRGNTEIVQQSFKVEGFHQQVVIIHDLTMVEIPNIRDDKDESAEEAKKMVATLKGRKNEVKNKIENRNVRQISWQLRPSVEKMSYICRS